MMKKKYNVVIDTNLWISFLIGSYNTKLLYILIEPSIQIFYTAELLAEIQQTAGLSRLQKKINPVRVDELIYTLTIYFTELPATSQVNICRDLKDNYLLALAKDAQADFLLTNDKDLLVLDPFENTRILKLNDFLTILPTLP